MMTVLVCSVPVGDSTFENPSSRQQRQPSCKLSIFAAILGGCQMEQSVAVFAIDAVEADLIAPQMPDVLDDLG